MAEKREIPVGSLLLDGENPRLDEIEQNQADAIHRMIEGQGEKLLVLAEDVLDFGLDPISLLLVMPSQSEGGRFVVLEGNRRLAAVKLLNNPDLAGDALSGHQLTQLRRLSQRFLKNPIKTASAVVVAGRDEADHWIERRHRGEQQGAGLVSWGATESARFDQRRGRTDPALQVLDLVRNHGHLDEETRGKLKNVAITNLQRLINDPDVRAAVGINKDRDSISLLYPRLEVLKGLTRMVADLAHERINVYDIDTKAERKKYLRTFGRKDLPNPAKRLEHPEPLVPGGATPARSRAAPVVSPTTRKTLIPREVRLPIAASRIAAIFKELRQLPIDQFTNAVAVLFRVFLELSVDHYVLEGGLMTEQEWERKKLPAKIQAAADDLKAKGIMTGKQLQPVRRLTSDPRMLAASVETFHAYVHNKDFTPAPGDLRAAWDSISRFFAGIWR